MDNYKYMIKQVFKLVSITLLFLCGTAFGSPIKIVAAENFYGDIAKDIGGKYVEAVSIMRNPNQDPHLFSSNWSTAKSVATANIIIYNGLGYDNWISNLINADSKNNRNIIIVADLVNKKHGDNPHIWYDPNTMLQYAKFLTNKLSSLDSAHKKYYQDQLVVFTNKSKTLAKHIRDLKQHYQGIDVIATEPVFNYMAELLGLHVQAIHFQLSMMNDTEPSATDINDFENQLRSRKVRLLIYNNQVTNPLTVRMQTLAVSSHIPILGVSELQPDKESYFSWMNKQLNMLDKNLAKPHD